MAKKINKYDSKRIRLIIGLNIDCKVSKFVKTIQIIANQLMHFMLFNSPTWRESRDHYLVRYPGANVTKHTFPEVFREAWLHAVRMSIGNGFHCPFNPLAVPDMKSAPSLPYTSKKLN